ncbi:acyl-CoA thioesterase [Nonomuraea sp. NPDC046570]|uniref:acyl-CoA thioesterase n=1 Tax=Nonomuraea sp. NPDC046570 TaxID=3155255 RepID=UPI0033CB3A4F
MGDFSVPITVRFDDTDGQGHLNSAVYHSYAEHARWCHLRSTGTLPEELRATGVGPVFLESTIRFRREIRAGETVHVSVVYDWPDSAGKTFVIRQEFVVDGTVAAELDSVCGLLDLATRRLVPDPRVRLFGGVS